MTIDNMRESLNIFQKYSDNDGCSPVFGGAEHDIIFSNFGENIPRDSEDGKRLCQLGWFFNTEFDTWSLWT